MALRKQLLPRFRNPGTESRRRRRRAGLGPGLRGGRGRESRRRRRKMDPAAPRRVIQREKQWVVVLVVSLRRSFIFTASIHSSYYYYYSVHHLLFLFLSLCLSLSLSVSLCIFCSELGFPPQLVSKLPLPTQNKFDLFVSNPPLLHIDFCIPMLSFFFFEMLGQRYSYAQRSAKSFLVFCYIFYISICVIFGILTSLIFRISVKIILSDCFSSSSGRLIDYIQPDSAASSPLFVFFKKIKLGVF